jgi:pyruvate/2-oxoglutarate dehydrogenase complex dihydrolipoamide acyltransferase (E2) component
MNIVIDLWTKEEEGALSKWFVSDGDDVRKGDMIATVSLEKAECEVQAPTTGTIRLLKREGNTVHGGDVIARIE